MSHTTTRASRTVRPKLMAGRAVSCWAVAAGITRRANTSNAPVIWLTSAAAHPSRTR